MLDALVRAFHDLADPPVRRIVLRCVFLALGTLVALLILVGSGLGALDATGLAWLDVTIALAGTGFALVLAWLLFPVTVVLVLTLFAEDVAAAVERRHYPALAPAHGLAFADSLKLALRFAGVALLLNLLALPLYLVPGANIVLYYGLNGYLLGREYFELVAQRRLSLNQTADLRRRLRVRIWLAGVVIALLLTVPLVNLVAPVLATAFMVHRFERWREPRPAAAKTTVHEGEIRAIRPRGDGSV